MIRVPGYVNAFDSETKGAVLTEEDIKDLPVITYLTQAEYDAIPLPKPMGNYCITDGDDQHDLDVVIDGRIETHNESEEAHPDIRALIQEAGADVLRPEDVVDNLTDGGSAVPLSAEQGKTLKGMIASLGLEPHDRGVVHYALESQADTYRVIYAEIEEGPQQGGTGYHVGDALFLNGSGLFIPAVVIVDSVNGNGAIQAVDVSVPGSFSNDPGGRVTLKGGHGTGAVFGIGTELAPSSTLADIQNPQVSDSATVLEDETHSGETWRWVCADYNGDGIANWVPDHRIDSEPRNFTADPIVADELAGGAVTDAKIGTRTRTDEAADGSLIGIAAKTLAAWLQGIRNNLKYVFNKALFKIDGINWSTKALSGLWWAVTYGDGKFVAVASSGNKAAYSADGINWTTKALSGTWYAVTYGDGKYVAVGDNKTAYSADGINWTTQTLSGYWSSVVYGNGKFVAVASDGITAYSTDGINWTTQTLSGYWRSVAYGDGKFVAVASDGITAYSADGINWTTKALSGYWIAVTYGDGKYVAVGDNKTAYSADGINWTTQTLSGYWIAVTYGDGKYVAAGDNKTAYNAVLYFKSDGTTGYPTAAQVGLGNVDNTSDMNKPVSTAQQTALSAKQDTLASGENIKTINSESLLGSGNIDIGGGGITAYTYAVDSDEALAAWAGNAPGNDYTSVLIKPGTWTSAAHVNLTASGTKVVTGMPGSELSFTSEYGLRYESRPATKDYRMDGVTVSVNSAGYAYGFYYCSNLANCAATAAATIYAYGFRDCDNLANCMATGKGTQGSYGFGYCANLANCTGIATDSNYTYAF